MKEEEKEQYVKKWKSNGLECLILTNPFGGLNGYVGVPKGHVAFDKNYDDLPIEVHGGLTFGSMGKKGSSWDNEELMYFGFDTLHYGDYAPNLQSDKDGHKWTLEEVVKETEDMAKQFSKLTLGQIIERKVKYEPDWFKDNIISKQFLSEKIETFEKSFIKTFDNQRASIELALDEKQEWLAKRDRKKLKESDKLRLQDQKRIFDSVMTQFENQINQFKKSLGVE